ncbi:hypothetical protein J3Q64DRAFT_1773672 [Phycomyces blakesleeanus]|uniref:Uncharacterized protein n=2 Tax=Phycomyces blakesleeanus TaxID=4837 RepID=A0A167QT68_PHYB8|nr:hypothetical protein PHYBLDRAFT_163253 [Phycomyces blakesleeanus NRRL 1555(-)]OAD80231.1 hypothetical protein PHYBLDRAFT_163253 [Phycomyces blakesleeanus NRRL 1555(-)]|eukprot:XP_018298271.1 hypothetical protein PHYBLDRAFT_163253 [Phycomyces blakesleeanus NRRL 1555(-)]
MVHAVICPVSSSQTKQELIYLDFQGSFGVEGDVEVMDVAIGDITFEKDTALLVIGHQRLEGKRVGLTKPFAVIKKRTTGFEDAMETDGGFAAAASYDVVCLIREKYVFSNRPGLIVQENHRGLGRIGFNK